MNNKLFTTLLALLFISLTAFGTPYEVKKQITKNFKVSSNSQLQIENKYGNIIIVPWSKNEIDFNIEIIGKADNQKDAQFLADRVSVDFNQSGNTVSARTSYSQQKNFSCNNCGTTVNYNVSVPTSVYLDLTNKYGNIFMDKTSQNFKAEIKYGNLKANELTGSSNSITIGYGNMEIGKITSLELDIKYGKADIDEVNSAKINSAYNKFNFKTVGQMDLISKYDRFNIETIKDFTLESAYTDFTISKLVNSFNASSLRYCKVKIDDIETDFSKININATYTNIRLAIGEKHSFQADISTRYGNIRAKGLKISNLTWNDESDRYTKTLQGTVGSQSSPKASITIKDTYADIVLTE